jgi:hypothetical protein
VKTSGSAREARLRAPRARASRRHVGDHLSRASASRGSTLPRHAQLRHRDRRGRGRGPAPDDPAGAPRRERGNAVRLEVAGEPTPASLAKLVKALKLDPERDVYRAAPGSSTSRPHGHRRARRAPRAARRAVHPTAVPPLRDADDVFATIRERTSSSITPTSRSTASSSSSRARPTTPTCSRSSRRSTAPAATRPS